MIHPDEVRNETARLLPEIIRIRRHLHQYPELSFQENETSGFIAGELKKYGVYFTTGWVSTGLVAEIKPDGYNGKRWIALRADMDALPIHEKNTCAYKSRNEGIMHACGHDAHTAIMLGVCRMLQQWRNELKTGVRVLFQPGEEKLPGGASLMIQAGALGNPLPEHITGLHVFPEMEAGHAGFKPGMYMASSDEIFITVKGRGGHAAMTGQYVNPILAASKILLALEAKFMDEKMRVEMEIPTVLAFGKIEGRGATNVIPDEVILEGTFRTMDETWRKKAHALIIETATREALCMNAEAEVKILNGYPVLVNDKKITTEVSTRAAEILGRNKVHEIPVRMTAEDFSYYSQIIPACFFRLGTANASKGLVSPVHSPTFDLDENALETGMLIMVWHCLKS